MVQKANTVQIEHLERFSIQDLYSFIFFNDYILLNNT